MKIPYEQIAAYLRGKASSQEKYIVEKWLAESDKHQQIFQSLEKEWRFLNKETEPILPNKEQVWKNIRNRIEVPFNSYAYSRQTLLKYTGIAASVALLIGLCISFLFINEKTQAMQFTAHTPMGEKAQLTLPDSSTVWLNSGSTLTYSTKAWRRIVHLDGEAFFEVTKNRRKRFEVHTGDVRVQVHGTSFNVSSYKTDPDIAVSLESGAVSLFNDKNGDLLTRLSPNQMGIVSRSQLSCHIVVDDPIVTKLWTNNILKIYNNDIYEVTKKLERWYGVNITVENGNSDSRYAFVVKTESLKELLDLLSKMTPIIYSIEGKEVHIQLK
jgi:ferric-dicitrate binding protein FerR (iron transport regulator)